MEIDIFGAEEIMWMPDVVAGEPFDESLDSSTGNEPYKMLATGFSAIFHGLSTRNY